ncbi:class I adenylate-forming enzyme family protein [Chachezhania antarctica]|uniref:class I adenylate-forming enzyme family protein n=1 Tax=Chachezhania antarctica TaxID=2340860 RepID=UPI000EAC3574|nr:AMP-binding protein [Chachezhania antarctica]|tara:strand:+ start:395 stop:1885 length:1491 start_codon:yes stop_codon:yes gene_type:complete
MERWDNLLTLSVGDVPDRTALIDGNGSCFSYLTLQRAVEDMRIVLTDAGVRPGDRVLVLLENCAAAVATIFACSRIGAWAVPVNARQTAPEIEKVLSHCQPAAVIATTAASPDAARHAARMDAREVTGAFGVVHLATPFPSAPEEDTRVAALLYTTGTTGDPKGVMLSHANLLYGARQARHFRGLEPGKILYGVAPFTHVMGLTSIMSATICSGATARLETRFSVEKLYAELQKNMTHLPAVPQMHALLMGYVKSQGHDRLESPTLEYTSSGGAPLDPEWKRRAERFYGLPLQNGYGLTETCSAVTVTWNTLGDPDVSVGRELPDTEIRIDEDVPGGGEGVGEVVARGPQIMLGYYRNPEATAAVLDADGWLKTGDLGQMDEGRNLHIRGRLKELIIHGGFNVYPPEVEAALNEHPKVIQCAVIGMMEGGDEKVVAFVQVSPDNRPDEADLRAFAAERLAGYKRPSRIIIAEDLPAAPSGKILKTRLAERFADALG